MTGYALAVAIGVASVGLLVAGAQSARLATAHTELATISATLADVRAKLERANRSRVSVETALASERDRAVEAEQQASDLRELIAKGDGTARDGATAPVLMDVLRTMRGPK